jgi:hypothetical protein
MKQYLFILSFLPLIATGQKLVENKIDDFTHQRVVATSWNPFVKNFGPNLKMQTRLWTDDETTFLGVKLMRPGPDMEIKEGAELKFKTEGDSIITLRNSKDQYSCNGCGAMGMLGTDAPGLDLSFYIRRDQLQFLATHRVLKVRIDLADGYWEHDVKDKLAARLQKQISLLN